MEYMSMTKTFNERRGIVEPRYDLLIDRAIDASVKRAVLRKRAGVDRRGDGLMKAGRAAPTRAILFDEPEANLLAKQARQRDEHARRLREGNPTIDGLGRVMAKGGPEGGHADNAAPRLRVRVGPDGKPLINEQPLIADQHPAQNYRSDPWRVRPPGSPEDGLIKQFAYERLRPMAPPFAFGNRG
jgi:hypothetical protein